MSLSYSYETHIDSVIQSKNEYLIISKMNDFSYLI